MKEQIDAVCNFLSLFLAKDGEKKGESIAWLAKMSIWHSFTADQAEVNERALKDNVRLGILRPATGAGQGRYRMHFMVREAAKELLKRQEAKKAGEARAFFVRGMASLRAKLQLVMDTEGIEAAKAVCLEEVPNLLGFCEIPKRLKSELNELESLATLLSTLGYDGAVKAIRKQVRRRHHVCLGASCHPEERIAKSVPLSRAAPWPRAEACE